MTKNKISAVAEAMLVEMWPVSKPIAYARNARNIPQTAIDKVAASIQEFGWRQPIVVDAKGVIVVGHTRLLAAQKLGLKEVPVHVADNLTPAQIKAYRLMDNRSHQESKWDNALLLHEFEELALEDFDVKLTGFDAAELSRLLGGIDGDEMGSDESGSLKSKFAVLSECVSESQQVKVLELLSNNGLPCRALL